MAEAAEAAAAAKSKAAAGAQKWAFVPTEAELGDIVEIMASRRDEEVQEMMETEGFPDGDDSEAKAKRRKVKTRGGRKIQAERLRQVLKELGASYEVVAKAEGQ